jgi:hypothetical protein
VRDIRDDLTDRLKIIAEKRRRILASIKALDMQEAAIKALLEVEDARFGGESLPLGEGTSADANALQATATAPTSIFRRFVLERLNDGQEWSLSRMRRQAIESGLSPNEDGQSLGRQLHAALLGLKQQGLVEIPVPGHWRLVRPRLVNDEDKGAA